jgi:hypothetical protein
VKFEKTYTTMDDEIETIGLVAVTKLCDDEIMKKKKKT